jgi:hypothetical protein
MEDRILSGNSHLEFLPIFADDEALSCWDVCVVSGRRYVQVKPRLSVDPPCVHGVGGFLAVSVCVMRVDVQQEFPAFWNSRVLVVMGSHVVEGGQVVEGRFCDEDAVVIFPWEGLAS